MLSPGSIFQAAQVPPVGTFAKFAQAWGIRWRGSTIKRIAFLPPLNAKEQDNEHYGRTKD